MNCNIIPLKIRPHLVSFFMKEMRGDTVPYGGKQIYACSVPRYSYLGKFVLERLEKIDYPVKDISTFTLFLEIKASTRMRYVADGNFYKIEKLQQSFVELPEKYVDEVNDFFEQHFRSALYNYIRHCVDNHLLISQAIINFIDKYDLYECGISDAYLRKLYYRMLNDGLFYSLQDKRRKQ